MTNHSAGAGEGEGRQLMWATRLCVVLWLGLLYPLLFLACVRIVEVRSFPSGPLEGVGRYCYFSASADAERIVHGIFRPCVAYLEERRLVLYGPHILPGFYEPGSAADVLRRVPASTGWAFCMQAGGRLRSVALGLAVGEALVTALLVAVLVRRWRLRPGRQRSL